VRANSGQRGAARWAAAVPVAVAVALAVTGCGQTQLGAAALYGGQRISASTLADEIANLNSGYQQYHAKVQIPYKPAAMPREVLTWMLRFAATNQVAAREGINVTAAEAQAQLASERSAAAQSGDTLREIAVLSGLPPDMLPKVGRWLAIESRLQDLLDNGVAPTTTAGRDALGAAIEHQQCLAAKSLNIKVNPQYGTFDYTSLEVVPSVVTLSGLSAAGKSHAKAPATTC